uniref:DUF4283 domain-containing protein n=1 Tax=Cannabis sativa TaxID=3483 RepID=A0A803NJ46_CANSA
MEDLSFNPRRQPLTLTSDENMVYTLDDLPSETPNDITLLLKLCTVKHFSRLSLIKTLSQIWTSQCRFPVVVSDHSEGLFLVTFGCEGVKRRILDGQPWHFAQSLKIFATPDSSFPITPDQLHYVSFWVQIYGIPFRCKSYELAKLIATGVGDLIQANSTTVKDGTGPYLRCDESLVPPPCPYDLLIRGKEKLSEKPLPFQYPHAPAITIVDVDISDFPQGGQVVNPYFTYSMEFTPLLNSHLASVSCLSALRSFASAMIPTPVNPNQGLVGGSFNPVTVTTPSAVVTTNPSMTSGGLMSQDGPSSLPQMYTQSFNSVSTNSIIVRDNLSSPNPNLVKAARSLADALPSLVLGRTAAATSVFQAEAPGQDSTVKGKGLACASGVKRPCFKPSQAVVGGSMRSMLKRARAGDAEFVESLSSDAAEQAGDAEHTRLEK